MMKNYFKKKIEKVIIVFRDEQTRSFCLKAVKWLNQKNIQSVLFCQDSMEGEVLKESADLLLVLGGDGTYLSAVRFVQNKRIPYAGGEYGVFRIFNSSCKRKFIEVFRAYFTGERW